MLRVLRGFKSFTGFKGLGFRVLRVLKGFNGLGFKVLRVLKGF